jgi:hypothetical protein
MNTISTKKLYIVGMVSLLLGLIFNYLFYNQLAGISFLIYVILLCTGLFGFLFLFKISFNKAGLWFLPVILFFAAMVGVRENEFLRFWNIVLTFGFLLLLARNTIGFKIRQYLFFDYLKTIVHLPFNMLGKSFTAFGRMISSVKISSRKKQTSQIVKGILITLPIALFFFFLFSSADLVFNKFVAGIFNINFSVNPDVATQIWLTLIFTILWFGAYIYILENVSSQDNISPLPMVRSYKFGNIEAGILFATLSALFLTFVVIQIKYLFAGHDAITKLGYTYAEYAHKGFGELIAVALLTFSLIFLAEKYIERTEDRPSNVFKILTSILVLLILVIMASAFMRLGIYEQAYGFTLDRILVQAFIIWLAAVFLWLGCKIIKNVNDRSFIFGLFLSITTFFILFNLINPDAFVTKQNINQFAKSGVLDTTYLASLSADAVPRLMSLLEIPGVKDKDGRELSKEVAIALKSYYEYSSGYSWKSFNVSRYKALQLIEIKWDLILILAIPENSAE